MITDSITFSERPSTLLVIGESEAPTDIGKHIVLQNNLDFTQTVALWSKERGRRTFWYNDAEKAEIHIGICYFTMVGENIFLTHFKYQILQYEAGVSFPRELQERRYNMISQVSSVDVGRLDPIPYLMVTTLMDERPDISYFSS